MERLRRVCARTCAIRDTDFPRAGRFQWVYIKLGGRKRDAFAVIVEFAPTEWCDAELVQNSVAEASL
jgi:hypothetical protein